MRDGSQSCWRNEVGPTGGTTSSRGHRGPGTQRTTEKVDLKGRSRKNGESRVDPWSLSKGLTGYIPPGVPTVWWEKIEGVRWGTLRGERWGVGSSLTLRSTECHDFSGSFGPDRDADGVGVACPEPSVVRV